MFKRVICLISLVLLTIFPVSATDISIGNLVPATTINQSDIFVVVTNTGGIAITRNITLTNLENSFLLPWGNIGSVPADLYQWANLSTNTPNINIGGSATYAVTATNVNWPLIPLYVTNITSDFVVETCPIPSFIGKYHLFYSNYNSGTPWMIWSNVLVATNFLSFNDPSWVNDYGASFFILGVTNDTGEISSFYSKESLLPGMWFDNSGSYPVTSPLDLWGMFYSLNSIPNLKGQLVSPRSLPTNSPNSWVINIFVSALSTVGNNSFDGLSPLAPVQTLEEAFIRAASIGQTNIVLMSGNHNLSQLDVPLLLNGGTLSGQGDESTFLYNTPNIPFSLRQPVVVENGTVANLGLQGVGLWIPAGNIVNFERCHIGYPSAIDGIYGTTIAAYNGQGLVNGTANFNDCTFESAYDVVNHIEGIGGALNFNNCTFVVDTRYAKDGDLGGVANSHTNAPAHFFRSGIGTTSTNMTYTFTGCSITMISTNLAPYDSGSCIVLFESGVSNVVRFSGCSINTRACTSIVSVNSTNVLSVRNRVFWDNTVLTDPKCPPVVLDTISSALFQSNSVWFKVTSTATNVAF